MVERRNNSDLQRSDLDTIIEVNNKAIELHTEVADAYETIIEKIDESTTHQGKILNEIEAFDERLETQQNKIEERVDEIKDEVKYIKEEIKEINKSQFRIQVLLVSGVLSVIAQIISLFLKK